MRVLMVCTDAMIGGAERLLVALANARREEDVCALVVLMGPGSLSHELECAFDEVHYLGFPPTSRDLLGMIRKLEQVSKLFGPDVVSSHLFHADLVTLLARIGVPKTTTVHTQRLTHSDRMLTRAIARLVGLLSFRFAAVIPVGGGGEIQKFLRSLRMRNVVDPIPNCAPMPAHPVFRIETRTFLSIARNHPVKGHAKLFKAFAARANDFPEWSLVAYGPGVTHDDPAMREALRTGGADLLHRNGRIRLLGETAVDASVYATGSALVISSIYGEANPIVGLEAAGMGIPVIATNLGETAALVEDPRLLVPPRDSQALGDAMHYFASLDDESRTKLSARVRARARAVADPMLAYERYRALFERLIGVTS